MRAAACGLSRAMYSASAFKFASARASHLTRTPGPLLDSPLHFLRSGELAAISLNQGLPDLPDLPFIQSDVFTNRLGRYKRATSLGRFGQAIEPVFQLCIETQGENGRFRHGCPSCIHCISGVYMGTIASGMKVESRLPFRFQGADARRSRALAMPLRTALRRVLKRRAPASSRRRVLARCSSSSCCA